MKRYFKHIAIAAAAVLALASCQQEQLNPESVIKDSRAEETEFDKWLEANLLNPYNIQIKYRYELTESNYAYWTTPADYDQSIVYAHRCLLHAYRYGYSQVQRRYLQCDWHFRRRDGYLQRCRRRPHLVWLRYRGPHFRVFCPDHRSRG